MTDRRRRMARPPPRLAAEPEISEDLREAVLIALRWAWARLRAETGLNLMTAPEEDITHALERLLTENDQQGRRRARALRLFDPVFRGGKHLAADGTNQIAPDLTFRPRDSNGVRQVSDWALFAECKIVGSPRHHSTDFYCLNGVLRFACGRYAPRVRHGLMIAYVRDARLPYPALQPLLEHLVPGRRLAVGSAPDDVVHSTHERGQLPHPCADIELTHLWLGVPASIS